MTGFLPPVIMEIRANAAQFYGEMTKVSAETDAMARKTSGSMEATGSAANKMAAAGKVAATATAVGLGAVAAVSVDMAAKFQKSTEVLVTAGGESQKNLDMVRQGILDVAQSTGVSATDLVDGMYTVEKATYRGADGLNVLKAAAQGAAAENVDMGTMTTALTSVMMSYHLSGDKAVATTNEMVAGAGAAKTSMQDYAGSLSTVLPVASAAGISFAQVGGAIATLTQHGTSADEATQELSNTIRGLQAPNNVAVNAMQQLGLNVQDVTTHLGQRGLTGTIQLITDAIASKLGPQGTVLVDTMKKSATGAADLTTMMSKMPPTLKDAAQAFLDGKMGMKDFQGVFKNMGADGDAQGKQFLTLANTVKGYNDQIKSGGPASQTAAAALKAVMGGATGMNTALMLGNDNMKTFKEKTQEIGDAANKSGKDISTNAQTQATLSQQLARTKAMLEAVGIQIGTALIPVVASMLTGFTDFVHGVQAGNPVLLTLLGVGGGIVAMLSAFYIGTKVVAAAQGVWSAATSVATGAQWLMNTSMMTSLRLYAMYGAEAVVNGAKSAGAAVVAGTAWLVNGVKGLAESAALLAMYGAQAVVSGAKSAGAAIVAGAGWAANAAKGLAEGTAQLVIYGAEATASGAKTVAAATVVGATWLATNIKTAASFLATNTVIIAQGVATAVLRGIQVAGTVAMTVMTTAQWALNAAMEANPIGVVVVALALLVGAVVLAYNKIGWFKDGVNATFTFIGNIATWLWQYAFVPAFQGIRTIATDVWVWVRDQVINPWVQRIQFIGQVFRYLWTNDVTPAINGVRDIVTNVWYWVRDSVFAPFGQGIKAIGTAFDTTSQFISTAWNKIKEAAAAPVRFILDTVYNDGIRNVWNTIAGAVGLSGLNLPEVKANFADGGVFGVRPGYTPGVDNQLIAVGGGEAIMRPEWTRAIGADRVHAMNAMAKNGNVSGIQKMLGLHGFADGGVVGAISSFIGGVGHTVADIAGDVASFVTDPIGSITKLIKGPVQAMLGNIGGGNMGKMVAQLPLKVIDALGSAASAGLAKLVGAGGSGGGSPVSDPGGGVDRWSGTVLQALSMLGQPAGLLNTTLRRMNQESGGNPNAINNWDSNAAAGIPSKGLMQVIGPTFASNAMPGYNSNIYDPLSNILASMRYAIGRYGSLAAAYNQPGGYASGGVVPVFDNGGVLAPGVNVIRNNTGGPEPLVRPGAGGTRNYYVTINAQTNADPNTIARELGWQLSQMA